MVWKGSIIILKVTLLNLSLLVCCPPKIICSFPKNNIKVLQSSSSSLPHSFWKLSTSLTFYAGNFFVHMRQYPFYFESCKHHNGNTLILHCALTTLWCSLPKNFQVKFFALLEILFLQPLLHPCQLVINMPASHSTTPWPICLHPASQLVILTGTS